MPYEPFLLGGGVVYDLLILGLFLLGISLVFFSVFCFSTRILRVRKVRKILDVFNIFLGFSKRPWKEEQGNPLRESLALDGFAPLLPKKTGLDDAAVLIVTGVVGAEGPKLPPTSNQR